MADTMVFALIGALIVTLLLFPVLCAWLMRNGVRERPNRPFECDQVAPTPRASTSASLPGGRWRSRRRLLAVAVLSLFSAREFMPKLDEGALWVRATMPYTISFDEAAKVTPRSAGS